MSEQYEALCAKCGTDKVVARYDNYEYWFVALDERGEVDELISIHDSQIRDFDEFVCLDGCGIVEAKKGNRL